MSSDPPKHHARSDDRFMRDPDNQIKNTEEIKATEPVPLPDSPIGPPPLPGETLDAASIDRPGVNIEGYNIIREQRYKSHGDSPC